MIDTRRSREKCGQQKVTGDVESSTENNVINHSTSRETCLLGDGLKVG